MSSWRNIWNRSSTTKKGEKMKKLICIITAISLMMIVSGCFKRDDLEDIEVYTTIYPIEYLTEEIYGYNSNVNSIYPNGVDVNEYTLTKKQVDNYSQVALFVYNGLSDEKKIAADFLNTNNKIKIIDVSQGLEYNSSIEELWISPSNYLMVAQNIRNSLKEYISNKYIREEIDNNYEELKVKLSEFDAELKIIAENATNKTLVVGSKMFKFLEKYGFEIIYLERDSEVTSITKKKVSDLISGNSVSHIFVTEGQELSETVESFVKNTKVTLAEIQVATTLTDQQRKDKVTYLDILRANIDLIKKEAYE